MKYSIFYWFMLIFTLITGVGGLVMVWKFASPELALGIYALMVANYLEGVRRDGKLHL